MKYEISGSDIILYEKDLSLDDVLDTGQAFRWDKIGENRYKGYSLDTPLEVYGSDGRFVFKDTDEDTFINIWAPYFDLDTDYSALRAVYSGDPTLKEACAFSRGIRLLRQDGWEALVSFIFSSNNNITRIKGIISRLAAHYGHFPKPCELAVETEDSLSYLRSGFRTKYIIDAAQKTSSGEVDLEKIKTLSYPEAKVELMKIKGVGPKVADCVLLSGFYKTEAFPVDVWIKRVLDQYYKDGFPSAFYETQGIAQLYLFNYIRKCKEREVKAEKTE